MKKTFILFLSVAVTLSGAAMGQDRVPLVSPTDEFETYRRQQGLVPPAAAPQQAAPVPVLVPSSPASPARQASPANPLGPAGSLPVAQQAPSAFNPVGALPNAFAPPSPEELQARAEAEAELLREKNREATFDAASEQIMPMRPEEIRKLLETFRVGREASETPITSPKPLVEVISVSLDPSAEPPTILTAPGRVTTLSLLDSTGAPWPVQDVSWGGRFQITPPPDGGNVIRITPQTAHGEGNMSLLLVDLVTPVTFTLRTGLDESHYRLDARIPRSGPLAKVPLIEHGGLKTVAGADKNLVDILDGVAPEQASRLTVRGADGRTTAWRVDDLVYLRTPLTLLSPGWDASVASADGMTVYALRETPVLLLSDNGRIVRASLSTDEVSQ